MTYKRVEKEHVLVHIPRIAPGELVIIDAAYINRRAAFVSSVKCAECVGKEVNFMTVRKYPRIVYIIMLIFIFLGMAFMIATTASLIA